MKKYASDIENELMDSSRQVPEHSSPNDNSQQSDSEIQFARIQERVQLSRILNIYEVDLKVSLNASYWKVDSSDDSSDDEVVINIGNLKRKSEEKVVVVESRALHITNLVRPFTLAQLTTLLSQTGTFDQEKGFWINHIRSHCYVIYQSTAMARQTMQALANRQWPVHSPKCLHVEYVLEESKQLQLLLRPLKSMQQQILEEQNAASKSPEVVATSVSSPPNSVKAYQARHRPADRNWRHNSRRRSRSRQSRRPGLDFNWITKRL